MQKDKASIEDLYTDLINLGRIFDVEKRAKKIVEQYKSELLSFTNNLKADKLLRVFVYDSGEDAPFTAGLYAMPTALIEVSGRNKRT